MEHKHKLIKKSIFFQGQTYHVLICKDRISKNCNYIRELDPMDDEKEGHCPTHGWLGCGNIQPLNCSICADIVRSHDRIKNSTRKKNMSKKYIISASVFETKEEAEEQIIKWIKNGSYNEDSVIYEIDENTPMFEAEVRLGRIYEKNHTNRI